MARGTKNPDRPNIVVCTCDQLRAFEVGCYGNPVIRTPNIDRLAGQSVRFETAVSNCPVCMPARSVLLSGQYSRTCTGLLNNTHDWLRDADRWTMAQYPSAGRPALPQATLAERLRDAGYDTTAIGKWHIESWPQDVGFDRYVIPRVYHTNVGQCYTEDGGPEFAPAEHGVDFEAGRVEAFLRGRTEQDRPFFLFYNISPPHSPLADIPERYRTMFDPKDMPLRPNVPVSKDGRLPMDDYWARVYRYDCKFFEYALPYTQSLPNGYDLRQMIAEYYGATAWVDDAVGRMLAALTAAGLDGETIVVFLADHGDMLGSHDRWQKGCLYEEAVRIPLMMRLPGGDTRVVREQVASIVDVAPTLLAAAGLDVPAHMQGQDLTAVLDGRREATDIPHAFIETQTDGIGIRTPSHMLGLPWDPKPGRIGDRPHYLCDLQSDPYQLAGPEQTSLPPETTADLQNRLRQWHTATPWLE